MTPAERLAAAFDAWEKAQTQVASGTGPELEELDRLWRAVTQALEEWRLAR